MNKVELINHVKSRLEFHKTMGPMGFVVVSELHDLLKIIEELE